MQRPSDIRTLTPSHTKNDINQRSKYRKYINNLAERDMHPRTNQLNTIDRSNMPNPKFKMYDIPYLTIL